jgi:hypothetical protein
LIKNLGREALRDVAAVATIAILAGDDVSRPLYDPAGPRAVHC